MTGLSKVDHLDLYMELSNRGFAVVLWQPEDVESVSKLKGEAAIDWLRDNAKYIEDRSVEVGWDIIDSLLDPEDRQDDND
jgi:hypothetical protein